MAGHMNTDELDEILDRYQGSSRSRTRASGTGTGAYPSGQHGIVPYSEGLGYAGEGRYGGTGTMGIEEVESHEESNMGLDEHGAHVGMRRSRTLQTPFGHVKQEVGVNASLGAGGLRMQSIERTHIRTPFGPGMTFMSTSCPSIGGCPLHSQSMPNSPFPAMFGSSQMGFGRGFYRNPQGQAAGYPYFNRHLHTDSGDGPVITELPDDTPEAKTNPVDDHIRHGTGDAPVSRDKTRKNKNAEMTKSKVKRKNKNDRVVQKKNGNDSKRSDSIDSEKGYTSLPTFGSQLECSDENDSSSLHSYRDTDGSGVIFYAESENELNNNATMDIEYESLRTEHLSTDEQNELHGPTATPEVTTSGTEPFESGTCTPDSGKENYIDDDDNENPFHSESLEQPVLVTSERSVTNSGAEIHSPLINIDTPGSHDIVSDSAAMLPPQEEFIETLEPLVKDNATEREDETPHHSSNSITDTRTEMPFSNEKGDLSFVNEKRKTTTPNNQTIGTFEQSNESTKTLDNQSDTAVTLTEKQLSVDMTEEVQLNITNCFDFSDEENAGENNQDEGSLEGQSLLCLDALTEMIHKSETHLVERHKRDSGDSVEDKMAELLISDSEYNLKYLAAGAESRSGFPNEVSTVRCFQEDEQSGAASTGSAMSVKGQPQHDSDDNWFANLSGGLDGSETIEPFESSESVNRNSTVSYHVDQESQSVMSSSSLPTKPKRNKNIPNYQGPTPEAIANSHRTTDNPRTVYPSAHMPGDHASGRESQGQLNTERYHFPQQVGQWSGSANGTGGRPQKQKKNKNVSMQKAKTTTVDGSERGHSLERLDDDYGPPYRYESDGRVGFKDLLRTVELTVKEVHADGNCMFSAVVDQLRIHGEFYFTARTLREAAVNYLEDNPVQADGTHLAEFVEHDGLTWDSYLARMRCDGHWCDHLVIKAVAMLLERPIVIYRQQDTQLTHMTVSQYDDTARPATSIGPAASQPDPTQPSQATEHQSSPSHHTQSKGAMSTRQEESFQICIGHIADSHYVSLRRRDWKTTLFEELQMKEVSCLLPTQKQKENRKDSNEDVTVESGKYPDVSVKYELADVDFLLNFVRRHNFLVHIPYRTPDIVRMRYHSFTVLTILQAFSDFDMELNIRSHSNQNYPMGHEILFPKDSKACVLIENAGTKDLLIVEKNCKPGYLQIQPVRPDVWLSHCDIIDEMPVLQHDFLQHTRTRDNDQPLSGFPSEWPRAAKEWTMRTRHTGWPGHEAIEDITNNGCYIATPTVRDNALENQHTMWQYNFDIADHMLYVKYMSDSMKSLYFIVSIIFNEAFRESEWLNPTHYFYLFCFSLESIPETLLKSRPGVYLMKVLDMFKTFLKQERFPSYYIKGENILDRFNQTSYTCFHLQRLEVLKSNIMPVLYMALVKNNLQHSGELLRVFDDLTELRTSRPYDCQDMTYFDVLAKNVIRGVNIWVKNRCCGKAIDSIEHWLKDWSEQFMDISWSKDKMLQLAMDDLSDNFQFTDESRWLFALYVDATEGSDWLLHLRGESDITFRNIIGDELPKLPGRPHLADREIFIPSTCVYQTTSVQVQFVLHLADLFVNELNEPSVGVHILKSYLKTNSKDIVLSEKTTDKRVMPYSIYLLHSLFLKCHEQLKDLGRDDEFKEMMPLLEEVCYFKPSTYNLENLAKLWTEFGNDSKAEYARTKATEIDKKQRSRGNDGNTVTRL